MSDASEKTAALIGQFVASAKARREIEGELLERTLKRLEAMARARLRHSVGVHEQTEEVLQRSLIRIHHALQDARVLSELERSGTRAYWGLAARHIRFELTDLARWWASAKGEALRGFPQRGGDGGEESDRQFQVADPVADDPAEFIETQELVAEMPDELREVFELRVYLEHSSAELAEVLALPVETIEDRYLDAIDWLGKRVKRGRGRK